VVLIGGAQAANIFWQVGSSATLGTYSTFAGTIMAQASVSLATSAALNGRALARTGAVTLDFNSAVNPGAPTTGGTPPALTVTCPLNSAQIGVAYLSLITASGGTPPYTFSITGSLPAGLSLNASTGTVTGTPTGASATFTARASDSGEVSASNSCTISTSAASQADLSIVKSAPSSAGTGTNITYNLAIANAGANSAASVVVTDVLPAGTTFVSATPSQGTCSGTSTVTCSLGTMANGGSATVVIVVAGPVAAGSVVNTAFVSSATPDPNASNNSSTATVNVVGATVPTLSSWGLGLLALMLAGYAVHAGRRENSHRTASR
jgi:uncharacterized repeat protein (TIGR01451 family)